MAPTGRLATSEGVGGHGTRDLDRCGHLRAGDNVQSATEDHSVRFHQYHLEDGSRIRVRKFCEVEDREVRPDESGGTG